MHSSLREVWRRFIARRMGPPSGIEPSNTSVSHSFSRMFQRLKRAVDLGFCPAAVLDVGASNGRWTRECAKVLNGSKFYCIEPLVENESELQVLCRENSRIRYGLFLAGASEGSAVLNVDGAGTSVLRGHWGNPYGSQRLVPMKTLDGLVESGWLDQPDLIKLDVQGYELEVLRGGEKTLSQSMGIIAEVSFMAFQEGMPEIAEVFAFMDRYGFVCYDIMSLSTRPLDDALAQADVFFVKADSPLRASNRWDVNSDY